MLQTTHLHMQPWTLDDAVPLRRLATDPRVIRYISDGQPWDDDRIHEFLNRQFGHQASLGYCMWKIVLKATGELRGICGLQPIPDTGETEIGWWLSPELWGQGLATEAATTALQFGFDQAKLDRIVAVAQPANTASVRIMEKLGMSRVGLTMHKGFEVVKYEIFKTGT